MPIKAWMRVLRITLTTKIPGQNGKNRQFVIEDDSKGIGLAVSVEGNKYMSPLKDNCTVKISNLTYAEIIQIISGQYYNVKIDCGYSSTSTQTIFNGAIMYISNLRESVDTNTITILCASHIVATYGQRRINLTFNSGINLYSAINFVCKVGGIPNSNISTQFKKDFLTTVENVSEQSAAGWLNTQVEKNGTYITNSDNVGNTFFTIFNAKDTNLRVIRINEENLTLTNGFPRLTSSGLVFSILPTLALQCGDTIVLDNALIQINVTSQQDAARNLGGLLDENGQYLIYEMHYKLDNRGNDFFVEIYAKTKSRIVAYLD